MKKIGIIGTRRRDSYKDFLEVYNKFREIYEKGDWIVSGGCKKGGDRFAEIIANKLKITILIFYADWTKGRGAGKTRNTYIAKVSDHLIACVSDDRIGGTEDTIEKFLKFTDDGYKLHLV